MILTLYVNICSNEGDSPSDVVVIHDETDRSLSLRAVATRRLKNGFNQILILIEEETASVLL